MPARAATLTVPSHQCSCTRRVQTTHRTRVPVARGTSGDRPAPKGGWLDSTIQGSYHDPSLHRDRWDRGGRREHPSNSALLGSKHTPAIGMGTFGVIDRTVGDWGVDSSILRLSPSPERSVLVVKPSSRIFCKLGVSAAGILSHNGACYLPPGMEKRRGKYPTNI
jgi:hypothetical protein